MTNDNDVGNVLPKWKHWILKTLNWIAHCFCEPITTALFRSDANPTELLHLRNAALIRLGHCRGHLGCQACRFHGRNHEGFPKQAFPWYPVVGQQAALVLEDLQTIELGQPASWNGIWWHMMSQRPLRSLEDYFDTTNEGHPIENAWATWGEAPVPWKPWHWFSSAILAYLKDHPNSKVW